MVSSITNTTLEDLALQLRIHDDYLICGHINPDGDCIGSALALKFALEAIGKSVVCTLAKKDSLDAGLMLLPGADEMVPAATIGRRYGSVISVDVPTYDRLGEDQTDLQTTALFTATIDHHDREVAISQLNYVDPDASATALLIWEIAGYLNVQDAPYVAECAYSGLLSDTGRFEFQNTDARAFKAAAEMIARGADAATCAQRIYENRSLASLKLEEFMIQHMTVDEDRGIVMSYLSRDDFASCNAKMQDSERLIDVLRSLGGMRVVCLFKETDEMTRISLRAKDDTDVSSIAAGFNGGGHKAAAGFTLTMALGEAIDTVTAALQDALE